MKMEHLFDGELWYVTEGAWAYGEREASGYTEGDGWARGERLSGTIRWSNRPARREDGVWLSDIRGFIQPDDDAPVLIEFRGRTMPERTPGEARDVVCSVTFRSADTRYAWVNDVVAMLEARHDPSTGRMAFRVYSCSNELISH